MEYERKVSPSILAADFGYIADAAIAAEKGGAASLHVDYMDGHYVPNISFGIELIPALKKRVRIPLIAHLMISNTDERLPDFIRVMPDTLVVQEDTIEDLGTTIERIRAAGVKPGVALSPSRPLDLVEKVLPSVRHLLILGVNPGFGGQSFMEETLEKMKRAHLFRVENDLPYDIAVDGGVNLATAKKILDTGANVLVAGTAVYGKGELKIDEVRGAISRFLSL